MRERERGVIIGRCRESRALLESPEISSTQEIPEEGEGEEEEEEEEGELGLGEGMEGGTLLHPHVSTPHHNHPICPQLNQLQMSYAHLKLR